MAADETRDVCPSARDDIAEAWQAQREVTARFLDAADQGQEVRRIVAEFKGIRDRNGFGRLLTKSMRLR